MGSFMNNPPPFKLPKISVKLVIVVLAAVVVLAGFFTSFFVVDQTEQAVVVTFGRFNRVVGAGLHFKVPFGIEHNYNVPTQITQNMEFGFRSGSQNSYSNARYKPEEEAIMLTGDLNIIDMEWIIQYNISDPFNWLFKVDRQSQTIQDISRTVMNELVGDRTIFDILGSARTEIESAAVAMMNDLFNTYELGVRVTEVKLQNIVPPQGKVSEAFDDVNKAQQDMNRLINEGKKQFNTEIPKARGEAQQLVQQAQGYATERVNKAQGDVARFLAVLAQYRADPQNTRVRLYNETMEELFGSEAVQAEGKRPSLIDKSLENVVPLLNLGSERTNGGAQ